MPPRGWRRHTPKVEGNRVCTQCLNEYPETTEFFYWESGGSGMRFSSKCIPCYLQRGREYRAGFEAQAIYKEWRAAGCLICGMNIEVCIAAHHVDPSTKTGVASQIYDVDDMLHELSKCVPLCANCHRILGSAEYGNDLTPENIRRIRVHLYGKTPL